METEEVLVGFQIGVLLGDHVDAWQEAGEHSLSRSDAFDIALSKGTRRRVASLSELVKDFTLVSGVPLNDVDQVGNHVVALVQQNIDVAPRLVSVFFKRNQTVPRAEEPNHEDKAQHGRDGNHGNLSRVHAVTERPTPFEYFSEALVTAKPTK